MSRMFLISPTARTVSYYSAKNLSDISLIIKPDYGVTTVRFNKYGDCLHFNAEETERSGGAAFELSGYLSRIHGNALITGRLSENLLCHPIYEIEQIIDLVTFFHPSKPLILKKNQTFDSLH